MCTCMCTCACVRACVYVWNKEIVTWRSTVQMQKKIHRLAMSRVYTNLILVLLFSLTKTLM